MHNRIHSHSEGLLEAGPIECVAMLPFKKWSDQAQALLGGAGELLCMIESLHDLIQTLYTKITGILVV